MSELVGLKDLLNVAAGFGTVPMLLSTDEDGRPRAAAVTVSWPDGPDGPARVSAGRKSLRNAASRPLVSLLWPAPPGERFALLVDAEVSEVRAGGRERDGGELDVRPTSAILHVVDRSRH